jgi:hypothetical protein
MLHSLSLHRKAKKNLNALRLKRQKTTFRAFLVCLFIGGGVRWGPTRKNQVAKQILILFSLTSYKIVNLEAYLSFLHETVRYSH